MRSRSRTQGIVSLGLAGLAAALVYDMSADSARGQNSPPEAVKPSPSIPPPRPFRLTGPPVQSTAVSPPAISAAKQDSESTTQRRPPDAHSERNTALQTPAILALPAGSPEISPPTNAHPPGVPVNTTLIPGCTIEPIDLASALRLAGARDLDIAIARQRISQAVADLEKARALWLPSLFLGPTWYRADGQIQTITGQVQTIDRNSLFIGALGATTAPGYPAAPPGTGYPALNGLSSVFRFSDAIYEPLAVRRVVAADRAGLQTANNDAMLQVALAYLELQLASGRIAIAREAASNASELSEITGAYARSGEGMEADHRRALTELRHRRKEIELVSGQLLVASANLVRVLVLNPRVVVAPVEPAETIIRLIPDDAPLDDLIVQGLQHRPELASAQELVQAALIRWKQAKLRPFVPSLAVSYAGGGFGGGPNALFANFGARGDATASLFWELQNLGFGDRAIMHRRAAEHETAHLELIKVETQVAADVVAADGVRQAALRQITEASEAVTEAIESLKLNFLNIRQGAELPRATRPIEVLQPIQALAQARTDYLESVLGYNRAQFQLIRAIGRQP